MPIKCEKMSTCVCHNRRLKPIEPCSSMAFCCLFSPSSRSPLFQGGESSRKLGLLGLPLWAGELRGENETPHRVVMVWGLCVQ